MKKVFWILVWTGTALLALIVLALVGYQLLQAVEDKRRAGVISGAVLDQDGHPLQGVELTFRSWNWRAYVPLPFGPTRIVEKTIKITTGPDGRFSAKGSLPRTDFVSSSKPGYQQDGPEMDYMWQPFGAGGPKEWTLHLFSDALVQTGQVQKVEFDSIPFPPSGELALNLKEGKVSSLTDADIVFRWKRLPATAQYGEHGKYTIRASNGGVWFLGQEKQFAPLEGYEDGMVFFFDPLSMGKYMKQRRAEFFLKSRNEQVYARVFAQLDTSKASISLRAWVNSTGNRFVDCHAETYAIGIYGSLSPNYLNHGVPWWIATDPPRGQVILARQHAQAVFTNDVERIPHKAYYAGYYSTPPDLLDAMSTSKLMQDHYVPQFLAKNVAAPIEVLARLTNSTKGWAARDAQGTLALPEDVKKFLTGPD